MRHGALAPSSFATEVRDAGEERAEGLDGEDALCPEHWRRAVGIRPRARQAHHAAVADAHDDLRLPARHDVEDLARERVMPARQPDRAGRITMGILTLEGRSRGPRLHR